LPLAPLPDVHDDEAGEESVREHPLGERLVEVLRRGRPEEHQVRLVDGRRLLLVRFDPHGIEVVGRRVERQQDVRDGLATVLAVGVDLAQDAVHLIILEEHGAVSQEGVLNALAAGELVPQSGGMTDIEEDAGVDLPRKVLARAARGQGQEVEVRPQVALIAHLPARQVREERHRAREGQAHVRVGRTGEREVHHQGHSRWVCVRCLPPLIHG